MRSLTTLLFILFTFFLTTLSAQSAWIPGPVPQGEYVPDQIILRFNNGYFGNLKSDFEQAYGVNVSLRVINSAATDFLITVDEGIGRRKCRRSSLVEEPLPCTMCEILGNPGGGGPMSQADGVWPNYIGSAGLTQPTNPSWTEIDKVVMENGFNPFYACPSTSSVPSHSNPAGGFTKIAILDSGIDANNPGANFDGFYNYNGNESIVEWLPLWAQMLPGDLLYDRIDPNGHGTAVGYLAAHSFVNNQQQENVRLLSLRILGADGRGNLADALRALDEAILKESDIINMSFGFQGMACDGKEDPIFDPYLADAFSKECLVFCSAGNAGNDINSFSNYHWPASEVGHPGFYTVGATNCADNTIWEQSNFSTVRVDLLAPGESITVPYVNTVNPGNYILADGTSFASPMVASVAASFLHFTDYDGMLCLLESPGQLSDHALVRVGNIHDVAPSTCPISFPTPNPGGDDNIPPAGGDITGRRVATSTSAYPNPFSKQITIHANVKENGLARIQVINAGGSIIKTISATTEITTLDLGDLKPGIYYLQIQDANGIKLDRIIKQ